MSNIPVYVRKLPGEHFSGGARFHLSPDVGKDSAGLRKEKMLIMQNKAPDNYEGTKISAGSDLNNWELWIYTQDEIGSLFLGA